MLIDNVKKNLVWDKTELWKPDVKILDEVSIYSKIFEIICNKGDLIFIIRNTLIF